MRLSAPIFRLKRRARLLARETGIPLHAALDRLARAEGFRGWSQLAAQMPRETVAADILDGTLRGDLMLLGARPGHGKTLLGLQLLLEAARAGRAGWFFTLEENEDGVRRRLDALWPSRGPRPAIGIDTSDGICAGHVMQRLEGARAGTVAVIDYLQLLDQRRENAALPEQLGALGAFARDAGATVVLLSQIDRAFEGRSGRMPALSDVRLPNPVDLKVFTKACFLHDGEIRLDAA
jgi:hypothetical protein